MPVTGTLDGPSGELRLRRIMAAQSPGDGWGQIRLRELREEWDGDLEELDRALEALEREGQVQFVSIGDVTSIQPA